MSGDGSHADVIAAAMHRCMPREARPRRADIIGQSA
jgi:hypothetical protein